MYVDIVISNAFNFNKHFYFYFHSCGYCGAISPHVTPISPPHDNYMTPHDPYIVQQLKCSNYSAAITVQQLQSSNYSAAITALFI